MSIFSSPDSPRHPANASKVGKDREVVGILMDMSEGRLPNNPAAENVNPTNFDNVQEPVHVELVNQPFADGSINPTVNHQSYQNNQLLSLLPQQIPGIQSIITVEMTPGQTEDSIPNITGFLQQPTVMDTVNMNSAYLNNEQASSVSSEQNSVDRTSQSVDSITNINNLKDEASHLTVTGLLSQPSVQATINTSYQANEQAMDLSINSEQTSADRSSQSYLDNDIHANNQITASSSDLSSTPQEMDSSGNVTAANEVPEVKSEDQTVPDGPNQNISEVLNLPYNSNNTIITQQILSSEAAAQLPGLSQGGPNDQYMLVTVMPESGQETVIHVYRLHGGLVSSPSDGQAAINP